MTPLADFLSPIPIPGAGGLPATGSGPATTPEEAHPNGFGRLLQSRLSGSSSEGSGRSGALREQSAVFIDEEAATIDPDADGEFPAVPPGRAMTMTLSDSEPSTGRQAGAVWLGLVTAARGATGQADTNASAPEPDALSEGTEAVTGRNPPRGMLNALGELSGARQAEPAEARLQTPELTSPVSPSQSPVPTRAEPGTAATGDGLPLSRALSTSTAGAVNRPLSGAATDWQGRPVATGPASGPLAAVAQHKEAALSGSPITATSSDQEPDATEQAPDLALSGREDAPGPGDRRHRVGLANRQTPEQFSHQSGREFPPGGKPLPSVLASTPARFAEGLLDRSDDLIRRVGKGDEEVRSSLREVDAGLQTRASAGLEARPQAPDLAVRVQLPALQAVAGGHSTEGWQAQNADAPGLNPLGGAPAGTDKAQLARPAGSGAADPGNNLFLHLTPDNPEWSGQLGGRIRWMQNMHVSSAELKLYPAELGTLEIVIAAEDDQTRISFVTSNPSTKDIIEASLPRLRELLGQNGLLLEHGDVSHRDSARGGPDTRSLSGHQRNEAMAEVDRPTAAEPYYRRARGDSQIDQFA